jgi:hypothetical protein
MAGMFDAGLAITLLFAAATRSLTGTLVSVETTTPRKIMVHAENQFQTFPVPARAVIERESRLVAPTTARVDLSDLTPGEYVKLEIDTKGRVKHARAVANLERAKVRSVSGSAVELEDGTTLTIGSVLRFVTAEGKPSATATVRPGETVLLFRHPETGNIYRFAAEPVSKPHRSARARKRASASKRSKG